MKKSTICFTLLALATAPFAAAQESAPALDAIDARGTKRVIEVRVQDPGELAAAGWEESEPGVWQTTTADGAVQEVSFGAAGRQRVLAQIDAELDALAGLEEATDRQLARSFTLSVQRAEIVKMSHYFAQKTRVSYPLCKGSGIFNYYFWTSYGPTYSVLSEAQYGIAIGSTEPINASATASVCVFGYCESVTNDAMGFFPSTVIATATESLLSGVAPNFCFASASGWVSIDIINPTCDSFVSNSTYVRCDQI